MHIIAGVAAVKLLNRLFLLPLLGLALCTAPLASATAQDLKPVAIVSIASVERNLADIVYLTRIVGMEDSGKTAMLFGNALTAGMDKTRPSGLLVVPAGNNFHAVAFLPVTDLKLLLEVHKEQVGEPKDVGGSVLEIGTDQKAFVKEQNGWAFLAEKKEQLGSLPADPAQLLGDLPKNYNVAARVLVQNIPADLKKLALDQMKAGAEQATKTPEAQADPNRAQIDQMLKTYMQQIERLMNEAEELSLGLVVNSEGKSIGIDVSFVARDGTDLAKQMAMQGDLKSSFAGFLLPDAAFSLTYASVISPTEIEQVKATIRTQREQVVTQLDAAAAQTNEITPEQKEALKKMLGQFFDLAEQAAASGKTDGGAVLMLSPGSVQFASGQFLPDGTAVDKIVQDAFDLFKKHAGPDAPAIELTMNAATHGEIKLHRGSVALPADNVQARAVFGDKFEFIVATGKTSAYLAAGKDCEAFLKKMIDRCAAEANKPVSPVQVTVAVLPILKFAEAQAGDNPLLGGLIASLEQDSADKLLIRSSVGPRSVTTRIEVQEGIIRVIGEGVKMLAAQFGGDLQ
jgi:hypothetical protein